MTCCSPNGLNPTSYVCFWTLLVAHDVKWNNINFEITKIITFFANKTEQPYPHIQTYTEMCVYQLPEKGPSATRILLAPIYPLLYVEMSGEKRHVRTYIMLGTII